MLDTLAHISPQLATILLAMTPYGELRLSLPVAYFFYDLPLWQSYFWSVLGNMVPPLVILLLADPFNNFVRGRSGFLGKKWAILLITVRQKFNKKYEKYGLIGLLLFVAIPLPTTGAWTASLIAFILGFPFKKSILAIFGGIIIAGAVISFVITGFNWF
jgi:uncharacterized membrane protein